MVSTTEKDNKEENKEEDSSERKSSSNKVNILGVNIDVGTLAGLGVALGLGAIGWNVYNTWNQNKPTIINNQQPPLPIPVSQQQPTHEQYNDYIQNELKRRQQMQRPSPQEVANATQTPVLENVDEDIGMVLDREKRPNYLVPPHQQQQHRVNIEAPAIEDEPEQPMVNMNIYKKRDEPSLEELYEQVNTNSDYNY